MPPALDDDDAFVAALLKSDAERSVRTPGLVSSRRTGSAPKPNTRFLSNIVREANSHNTALLAKEAAESRARLRRLKEKEKDGERSRSRSRDVKRRKRERERSTEDGRRHRHRERSRSGEGRGKHRRRSKDRSGHHRSSRRRSASPDRERTSRHHHHHRRKHRSSKTHEEEIVEDADDKAATDRRPSRSRSRSSSIGPKPPSPVRIRGRGVSSYGQNGIDSRFHEDYDPTADVRLESAEEDEWGDAVEAFRDRQKWKTQGAERLRAAGFDDDFISAWESNTGVQDEGRLKWAGKGKTREWDRGKVVQEDGSVGLKAAWS